MSGTRSKIQAPTAVRPSPAKTFAAIDVGTTSIKCIALYGNDPGTVHAIGSRPTPLYQDGARCEVDPSAVLNCCLELLHELFLHAADRRSTVATIGLTGFIGSVVAVDRNGAAVTPCPIWCDSRCAEQASEFAELPQELRQAIHGIYLPPGVCWPAPKLRWLYRHHRQQLANAWKILQIKDYLFFHLTGHAYSEACTFTGLANVLESRFHPAVIKWSGIRAAQLPTLYPADFALPLLPRWKDHFGLTADSHPRIGIGTADMTASFFGCQLSASEGVFLANTAEIIGFATKRDENVAIPSSLIRIPYRDQLDLIYGSTTNGGASLNWFRDLFGVTELSAILLAADRIPPGCDGVTFIPYLAGERAPIWRPDVTGAFAGLRTCHTQAHLFRAVLEGCAFSKRHVFDTASISGVTRLRLTGGSARIALWNQIRASVLGLPIHVDACLESSALGALLLTAQSTAPELLNLYQAHRREQIVQPIASWQCQYDQAYTQYRRLVSHTLNQEKHD